MRAELEGVTFQMDTAVSSHAARQEYWELDRSKTHFADNQAACVLQSGTSLLSVLTSLFPNRVATKDRLWWTACVDDERGDMPEHWTATFQ